MLAHKATYEGKIAVEVIAGEPAVYDARAMPAVVFTDPEMAWCGLTETEAKKQNREVKVRQVPLGRLRPGHDAGPHRGADEADRRSRDASACWASASSASEAGEMIAEAMLAIEMAASARDVALTIHAHPTLSETLVEAAESLYGLATHTLPKK